MADTPTGSKELTDQAFRNTDPRQGFFEATYGGALSFCRRPYSRDLTRADVAVVGIPFDSAVTNRPGCRLGPRAVRAASTQLAELKSVTFGFDPFDHLAIVDYGDMTLNPHDPQTVAPDIFKEMKAILATDTVPLSLGGDHFIAYALLKAQAEKHGPVALLQFDAHADTWDSLGPIDHGTMFKRAVEEGLIDTAHSMQIGLRTHTDDAMGIEQIFAPECHELGPNGLINRIRARVGQAKVYLSFDIDCLDPAFAPGTGTPVCGGLATWQALAVIRALTDLQFVGMDLVEVSPPFDHAEITALAGASLAYEWLCVLAEQRRLTAAES